MGHGIDSVGRRDRRRCPGDGGSVTVTSAAAAAAAAQKTPRRRPRARGGAREALPAAADEPRARACVHNMVRSDGKVRYLRQIVLRWHQQKAAAAFDAWVMVHERGASRRVRARDGEDRGASAQPAARNRMAAVGECVGSGAHCKRPRPGRRASATPAWRTFVRWAEMAERRGGKLRTMRASSASLRVGPRARGTAGSTTCRCKRSVVRRPRCSRLRCAALGTRAGRSSGSERQRQVEIARNAVSKLANRDLSLAWEAWRDMVQARHDAWALMDRVTRRWLLIEASASWAHWRDLTREMVRKERLMRSFAARLAVARRARGLRGWRVPKTTVVCWLSFAASKSVAHPHVLRVGQFHRTKRGLRGAARSTSARDPAEPCPRRQRRWWGCQEDGIAACRSRAGNEDSDDSDDDDDDIPHRERRQLRRLRASSRVEPAPPMLTCPPWTVLLPPIAARPPTSPLRMGSPWADPYGGSADDASAFIKLDRPSVESQLLRGRSSRVHFFDDEDDGAGVGTQRAPRRTTAPDAAPGLPDAGWSGDPSGTLRRTTSRRRS